MPKLTLSLFAFLLGAMTADLTRSIDFDAITDTEVECGMECLKEEPPMPPAIVLECSPSEDGTYVRCV